MSRSGCEGTRQRSQIAPGKSGGSSPNWNLNRLIAGRRASRSAPCRSASGASSKARPSSRAPPRPRRNWPQNDGLVQLAAAGRARIFSRAGLGFGPAANGARRRRGRSAIRDHCRRNCNHIGSRRTLELDLSSDSEPASTRRSGRGGQGHHARHRLPRRRVYRSGRDR
jgi:hypothetical protein